MKRKFTQIWSILLVFMMLPGLALGQTRVNGLISTQPIAAGTTAADSKAIADFNSTTKGLLPPRMTTTQRDAISSPTTGLVIYNTTTNTLNQYTGSAWTAVGSGGGTSGINYVTAYTADDGLTGWANYADAAATTPVDGNGGSPTTAIARSTSSPLIGTASFELAKSAANRQGEGVSYDFTIDPAFKGQSLQTSFNYEITSGTYADGDVRIYIYDVTNSRLIEPDARDLKSTSIKGIYVGKWQASSDSTSYRLIYHIASTSASAYTIHFDNVKVSPELSARGAIVTDTVLYTPILTAVTTNPTIGNGTIEGSWRRVGSDADIFIKYTTGSTTSAGSGGYRFSIPSGLVIDTARIPSGGTGFFQDCNFYDNSSSANEKEGSVLYSTTTTVGCYLQGVGQMGSGTTGLGTDGDIVTLRFRVPIAGWSSGVDYASDAGDGSPVAFEASTPTSSHTSSVAKITGWTKTLDTKNQWDSTNNRYVIPSAGIYRVTLSAAVANTAYSSTGWIYVNGSAKRKGQAYANGSVYAMPMVSYLASFNAGDYIEGWLQSSSGSSAATDSASYFSVEKQNGSPSILAGMSVVARAYLSANQTGVNPNASAVKINFDTIDFDSTGSWSTSNKKFTAPVSGTYEIATTIFTSSTNVLNNAYWLPIYKNGSLYTYLDERFPASSTPFALVGSTQVKLLQGETLEVYYYGAGNNSASTLTVGGGVNASFVSIKRVGNY